MITNKNNAKIHRLKHRLKRGGLAFLPVVIAVSGFLSATSAAAQEDVKFDIRPTLDCLGKTTTAARRSQCVGTPAEVCIDETPAGGSTYVMGMCLNFDAEWWGGRLNNAYDGLFRREERTDAELATDGVNAPQKAPALQAMQQAWVTFRDTTCAYEYTQWGDGTGGGPASIACSLRMNAEQTF